MKTARLAPFEGDNDRAASMVKLFDNVCVNMTNPHGSPRHLSARGFQEI